MLILSMSAHHQVKRLIEENYFYSRRIQEDLRFGMDAKARHFILEQVIGHYNLQELWYAGQDRLPDLIREDQLEWQRLLDDLRNSR